MKKTIAFAALAAAAAAFAADYQAEATRSGSYVHIPAGETVKGGLAAYGAVIVIDGTVDGDLMAFGADVRVNGAVTGDALVCAATAAVPGRVAGDAQIFTAVTDVPGEIGGNLKTGCAAAYLRGEVAGTTEVNGAAAWLGGAFAGAVTANADYLVLEDGAALAGDLNYRAKTLERAPTAAVAGKVKLLPPPEPKAAKKFNFGWWALKNVWCILALFVIAVFVQLLRPPLLVVLPGYVRAAPGRAFLVGLALLVGVPLAALLTAVTVAGIPAAGVIVVIYAIVWWTARVFAGALLGRLLLQDLLKVKDVPPLFAALVGITALVLLGNVPVFKHVLGVATAAAVLGAWGLYLARIRRYDPGSPAR